MNRPDVAVHRAAEMEESQLDLFFFSSDNTKSEFSVGSNIKLGHIFKLVKVNLKFGSVVDRAANEMEHGHVLMR